MSAVNLAEVLTKLVGAGMPVDAAAQAVAVLGIEIAPLDGDGAAAVAALWPATRAAGLSLGDRACLGLALSRGAVAWTTDTAWTRVETGAEVHLVRRGNGG